MSRALNDDCLRPGCRRRGEKSRASRRLLGVFLALHLVVGTDALAQTILPAPRVPTVQDFQVRMAWMVREGPDRGRLAFEIFTRAEPATPPFPLTVYDQAGNPMSPPYRLFYDICVEPCDGSSGISPDRGFVDVALSKKGRGHTVLTDFTLPLDHEVYGVPDEFFLLPVRITISPPKRGVADTNAENNKMVIGLGNLQGSMGTRLLGGTVLDKGQSWIRLFAWFEMPKDLEFDTDLRRPTVIEAFRVFLIGANSGEREALSCTTGRPWDPNYGRLSLGDRERQELFCLWTFVQFVSSRLEIDMRYRSHQFGGWREVTQTVALPLYNVWHLSGSRPPLPDLTGRVRNVTCDNDGAVKVKLDIENLGEVAVRWGAKSTLTFYSTGGGTRQEEFDLDVIPAHGAVEQDLKIPVPAGFSSWPVSRVVLNLDSRGALIEKDEVNNLFPGGVVNNMFDYDLPQVLDCAR